MRMMRMRIRMLIRMLMMMRKVLNLRNVHTDTLIQLEDKITL